MTDDAQPAIANPEQYAAWNGDSGRRWVTHAEARDRVLAPFLDLLLDAADIPTGAVVLDVGCGCGATTLAAASRAGTEGRTTGLDLSAPMLDVARQRAHDRGVDNVEFVQADAQTHQPAAVADRIISRFGTMFFADPVAAFANLGRGLAPRGALTLLTWQPLAVNEWLRLTADAVEPHAPLPVIDPEAPGMFALSDTDRVAAILTAAGFGQVDLEAVEVDMVIGPTVEEAADYLKDTGPVRMALEGVEPSVLRTARDALADALSRCAGPDGVTVGSAVWLVRAGS